MKILRIKFLLIFSLVWQHSISQKSVSEIRNDFKNYYDHYHVQGSFVLYDQTNNKYTFYNKSQYNRQFIPSSIFKICNALIGLETGVIIDESFVIKWDGIIRSNSSWNCDQDLKTAFKNSTVWYYQELARRVGSDKMKYWLDKLMYGNADTSGGIDKFWLTGGLRVTPRQEIDFLYRLYNNKLPLSQRTMDIVKRIMVTETSSLFTLSSKTGWGMQDNSDIGWYVGYVEIQGNVYFFANCIQTKDVNNKDFSSARVDITRKILADLNLGVNLKITPLINEYYIFTTYKPINGKIFPSNGMYCVTSDGVIMFDTPWDTTQLQPLLDSIYKKHQKEVVVCIATHFHDDRTAGLDFFNSKGIKTFSSKQTYDLCKANHEKIASYYFTQDTLFTIGKHRFQTYYPGEGHTSDNIVIWCCDSRILYGGCLVKSTEVKNLGNTSDSNINTWPNSLKNVMNKYPDPDYVIPGHYGWTSNQGLVNTLKLLKQK